MQGVYQSVGNDLPWPKVNLKVVFVPDEGTCYIEWPDGLDMGEVHRLIHEVEGSGHRLGGRYRVGFGHDDPDLHERLVGGHRLHAIWLDDLE